MDGLAVVVPLLGVLLCIVAAFALRRGAPLPAGVRALAVVGLVLAAVGVVLLVS